MRTCPNCKSDLFQKKYGKILVDECGSCKGVWFDRDELRRVKDSTDDDLRWLDYDPFEETTKSANASNKLCPNCNMLMVNTNYDKSKVSIDTCTQCKGVWLDKDELDKIIAYLESLVVTKNSTEYAKEAIEEFKEILTGPESRLSELKDFVVVANFLQIRYAVEHPWIINLSRALYTYWPLK